MASGTFSALGSLRVGRAAHGGPAHHGRGVSTQLASVPGAASQRMDPTVLPALVLRAHPFPGRPVLLLAVQGPEAQPRRFFGLRSGFRTGRICGNQQLAANAERRGMGAADSPLLSPRHARRAAGLEHSVVRRIPWSRVLKRPSSDSDFHLADYGRGMAVLL